MKKFLLLCFLLSSGVAFGQHSSPAGHFRKWIDIPSAPSLSSPTTIVPGDFCCGPGIFNFTLLPAPPSDGKTSGNFTAGFSLRQFDGTAAHEYRFVNTAGDVYGANGGAANGIGTTNSGNFLRLYGLNATNPMYCRGNIGVQLPSATVASGGFNGTVQNVVINTCTNSGITGNYGINGTRYYENILVQFVRIFNPGQEGGYWGDTGGSYDGTNYINILVYKNNFSYNCSREGTQFEHVNLLTATHNTCILSGQTGGGSQNNSLQAHDLGPGSTISYSIYDGSPIAFNIFTHGTKVENDYFSFNTTISGGGYVYNSFIGRTDNSYFSTSTRLTGDSLIFDGDYFNYTGAGTLDYLVQVNERVAHIIFRNCKFSTNITNIMRDNRAVGFTNTLTGNIGDHGNTSVAITAPVYITNYNNPDTPTVHGLINTSSVYYALHFGYRTP